MDQKTYISNLNKISEQKIVRDSLQTRSFELKTQADEVAKSITSTPSDIKIRVGNLEQVAPDKRKLTELSLLRDTTENTLGTEHCERLLQKILCSKTLM